MIRERVMGLNVSYDPRSAVGQRLYFRGRFELAEIQFCSKILAGISSPMVIDIGANIGIHCLYWAVSNKDLKCSAFEPSRSTAGVLRNNIQMNGAAERVQVHEVALSNVEGEAPFYECSDAAFSSLKDTKRKPVVNEVLVSVTTLDSWVSVHGVSKVDLVKIDVEGLEHEVIEGARDVLQRLRPHLFVEIFGGERSNRSPEKTVETIVGYGYDAFVFDKGGGLMPYKEHTDRNYNYYFSPR